MAEKKLKLWNGRIDNYEHGYIAAYSVADAVRLCADECPSARITPNELNVYWSNCWGNSMIGVARERGIWVEKKRGSADRALTAEHLIVRIRKGKEYPVERGPEWAEFQIAQQIEDETRKAAQQQVYQERQGRLSRLIAFLQEYLHGTIDHETGKIIFEGHEYRIEEEQ